MLQKICTRSSSTILRSLGHQAVYEALSGPVTIYLQYSMLLSDSTHRALAYALFRLVGCLKLKVGMSRRRQELR